MYSVCICRRRRNPTGIEQSLPFEGRILCDGVSENMYHHIQHSLEDTLADIRLDEDGEMRVLGIEATLSLRMNIFGEEETEILRDLYSLDQQCVFETKDTVLEELLMQNQSKCKISERLSLPELKDDVLQIIHSQGSIQVESEQYTGRRNPSGRNPASVFPVSAGERHRTVRKLAGDGSVFVVDRVSGHAG